MTIRIVQSRLATPIYAYACIGIPLSSFLPRSALVKHGHAVNLDISTGAVQHATKAGPCNLLATKILTECFVKEWEISHVPQYDAHIDNVLGCCACSRKHAHQIVECLASLHHNIARHDGTGAR